MDKNSLRIMYMGTPEISAKVLRDLINNGYNIVGVIAQEDKPVGRKKIIEPVPTKKVAMEFNIPVYQPHRIRKDFQFVKDVNPDVIITLAYGQIVPHEVLVTPKYGCLNLHGSLLPKYRGAAPIQYALINNETITGMTLMEMTDEMDAGRIYATEIVHIDDEDNSTSLFIKMGEAASKLILRELPNYIDGLLEGKQQDVSLVTFCPTIKPEEEKLDLNMPSKKIIGYIRGLSDEPGAYLLLDNEKFKIYKAQYISNEIKGNVGEIVKADKQGLHLQCKDGIISLLTVQKSGKNKMDYKSFINGNQGILGKVLD